MKVKEKYPKHILITVLVFSLLANMVLAALMFTDLPTTRETKVSYQGAYGGLNNAITLDLPSVTKTNEDQLQRLFFAFFGLCVVWVKLTEVNGYDHHLVPVIQSLENAIDKLYSMTGGKPVDENEIQKVIKGLESIKNQLPSEYSKNKVKQSMKDFKHPEF